ncbi:MAG: hypothetical protein A2Y45_08190 [Tenericutes bacterium GWC2_34_14]|nr:MAG: hypothetical protein A2Z84_03285 [Tenericutes bacterium GWA2_35_7]OHE29875.1 MAG: hypothetical protein A2Y45_08190 [Tenericutes bacterium GWC2_34_14]OHE34854.1 MAG: hypothetical protein A2012_01800 [Tenericutes bacterium GWE2_34_108]OHE37285.1 MAG: hypothetical protein A2Y46_01210 [Tenericutes bacterium GWF1_35_14]OHE39582.1 MAG: hypothetical protein A2Y44_01650 [Tenericutes bacterium GWF2_35_184]OHE41284.1 MAG: hypothetical protein A3K26_06285 [Tenericutes bacterium RIFOXYA12_FULL_35_
MVKELEIDTTRLKKLVDQTLSASQVSGKSLRLAHYNLGIELSRLISQHELKEKSELNVLVKMRSGLCLGLGIADGLEHIGHIVHLVFEIDQILKMNHNKKIKTIIVDGVINTGNTILKDIRLLNGYDIIVATNVISKRSIDLFESNVVYATRISEHFYVGSNVKTIDNNKGPDTSERLFNNDFFN